MESKKKFLNLNKLSYLILFIFLFYCSPTQSTGVTDKNLIDSERTSLTWEENSIRIANITSSYFEVLWDDPKSINDIKNYKFYLNDELVLDLLKENDNNSIFLDNLNPNNSYKLEIVAIDNNGNRTNNFPDINITTKKISRSENIHISHKIFKNTNLIKFDEIINKTIQVTIPQKVNFQIGELLKFVNKDQYVARISVPYSFQSGSYRSLNNLVYEQFIYSKDFDFEIKNFPKGHILNVHLYNVSGTLVSYGYEILNDNLVKTFKCLDKVLDSWFICSQNVVSEIKNNIYSEEHVYSETEDEVKFHYKLGTQLVVGQDSERKILYLCESADYNFKCKTITKFKNSANLIPIINENKLFIFRLNGEMYVYNLITEKIIEFSDTNYEVQASNQFYFKEDYLNRIILGHYNSGGLMEFTTNNELNMFYNFENSTEVQSFGSLNGYQFYGNWPYGELIILSPEGKLKKINLFSENKLTEKSKAVQEDPFLDIVKKNFPHLISNILGRRVTTIVPCFEGICVSTGNKNLNDVQVEDISKFNNLAEINNIDIEEYGMVYYIKGNHKSCKYLNNEHETIEIEFMHDKFIVRNLDNECDFVYPEHFDSIELLNPFLINNGALSKIDNY